LIKTQAQRIVYIAGGEGVGFTMTTLEIIGFLEANGFWKLRTGRHPIMTNGEKTLPIPVHKGDLPKGTVSGILQQAGFRTKQAKEWKERG
jgi:predicted RNA binding protein YcfA (HicA-like mRNA interferase family)